MVLPLYERSERLQKLNGDVSVFVPLSDLAVRIVGTFLRETEVDSSDVPGSDLVAGHFPFGIDFEAG